MSTKPTTTRNAKRPGRIRPGRHFLNVVSATLRANRKKLKLDPDAPISCPITARTTRRGSPVYATRVEILDAAGNRVGELVYDPYRPLGCGAVVYLIADHGVRATQDRPARAAQSVLGRARDTGSTP